VHHREGEEVARREARRHDARILTIRGHDMRTTTIALLSFGLAACGGERAPSDQRTGSRPSQTTAAQAAAEEAPLRPAPGADIEAPPAPPDRGRRVSREGAGEPIDLGKDRQLAKVRVPTTGRGAATTFTFPDANGGEDREGWVARIPESNQLPSVAYGDGRVYVSGGFESVSFYALDADDGRFVWSSRQLEDNGPTAPIYDDERVIFNTESCTLFVMDARTGKKLWFKYLGDPTLAQPAVADGLVYAQHPAATDTGFALTAYRIKDGSEAWTRTVDGELLAAPVVAGDSVYVSTIGGRLYRFAKKSGKRFWSVKLDVTSAPWVDGPELFLSRKHDGKEEQIVVSIEDGKILRTHRSVAGAYLRDVPRDMNDWKKVWAFEGSRPAIVGGTKYEAMGGVIQASDPQTGEPYWTRRYAPGEHERSVGTVAVAGPQVVIATRTGELYGLDVDTGYTLWAYDLGQPVVAQPVVAKGWVYATTTDGTVVALNVGDSTLDGWHMWGGNPHHNGPVTAPGAPSLPKTSQRAQL
jgi:outer membrane protein assembly factor BamB